MSWAEVKKINSDLSIPLDYLMHCNDIKLNEYDSYVFKDPDLVRALALNTTHFYDFLKEHRNLRAVLDDLDHSIWEDIFKKHRNIGGVLNRILATDIFINGNIDILIGNLTPEQYKKLGEKETGILIEYILNNINNGGWINKVFDLNSKELEEYTDVIEILRSPYGKTILSSTQACYILRLISFGEHDYIQKLIDIHEDIKDVILDTVSSSLYLPSFAKVISEDDNLFDLVMEDEEASKALFSSMDNFKIIMLNNNLAKKIASSEKAMFNLFEYYTEVLEWIYVTKYGEEGYRYITQGSEYLEEKLSESIYAIDYLLCLGEYRAIDNNIIGKAQHEEYISVCNNLKNTAKNIRTILKNFEAVNNSEFIDDTILYSRHATYYLNYVHSTIIYRIVDNDDFVGKMSANPEALLRVLASENCSLCEILRYYDRYGELLKIDGAKETIQGNRYMLNKLIGNIDNEYWAQALFDTQEDYIRIFDINNYNGYIPSFIFSYDYIDKFIICSTNSIKRYYAYSEICNNSRNAAKVLLRLSEQDTNIDSLEQITLEQFKRMLNYEDSRYYIYSYSDFRLRELIRIREIHEYIYSDEGREFLIELLKASSSYGRSVILGSEEDSNIIINNLDILECVVENAYKYLYYDGISSAISNDINASKYIWSLAFKEDSKFKEIIEYILTNTNIANALGRAETFYRALIDTPEYMNNFDRDLFIKLFKNDKYMDYISKNAYVLNTFLKNEVARDILVVDCNENLQKYAQNMYTTALNNNTYFTQYTTYTRSIGVGSYYQDIPNNEKYIYFSRLGYTTNVTDPETISYHGYKFDSSKFYGNIIEDSNYIAYKNTIYNSNDSIKVTVDGGYFYSPGANSTLYVIGYLLK